MLNKYEELLEEAAAQNISVDENFPFHGNLKGLYVDQNIALSDQLETSAEKACILAEEQLRDAIADYRSKYGVCTKYQNYYIMFEPYLMIGKKK